MDVIVPDEHLAPTVLPRTFDAAVVGGDHRLWRVLARKPSTRPGGARVQDNRGDFICGGGLADVAHWGRERESQTHLHRTRPWRELGSRKGSAAGLTSSWGVFGGVKGGRIESGAGWCGVVRGVGESCDRLRRSCVVGNATLGSAAWHTALVLAADQIR